MSQSSISLRESVYKWRKAELKERSVARTADNTDIGLMQNHRRLLRVIVAAAPDWLAGDTERESQEVSRDRAMVWISEN